MTVGLDRLTGCHHPPWLANLDPDTSLKHVQGRVPVADAPEIGDMSVFRETLPICLQELGQLGIEGTNVRRELRALAGQLPSIFGTAVERLRDADVADAVAHYVAFAQYAHPSPAAAEADGAAAVLPTLSDMCSGTVPAGASEPYHGDH